MDLLLSTGGDAVPVPGASYSNNIGRHDDGSYCRIPSQPVRNEGPSHLRQWTHGPIISVKCTHGPEQEINEGWSLRS